MTANPVGEEESATMAASTSPDATSASAAARSSTEVTSSPLASCTYCWASAVTATGVPVSFFALKPSQTTPIRAMAKRMPNEMRNDLLRSFEPISRSATSHALWAKPGAWTDVVTR